ncbi:hypothetical protein [Salmonella phage SD-2_S15]|nr:hypothetical protein [Salmonella phage SD-2_S15]WPK19133.1 hypothetical protein [Salmonella phage SD-6_S16]WPK20829.1 hypothetical protein [Salmonella phage SD-15_S21]
MTSVSHFAIIYSLRDSSLAHRVQECIYCIRFEY